MAAALDTPIASGETEYTRYGFRRMLELRSADILMPDLQRVGGVSEFMRVGHMAESYDHSGVEPSVPGDQPAGARRARERDLSRIHAVVFEAL